MLKSFVERYVPRKRHAVHGPSYAGDAVLLWGFLGLAEDLGRGDPHQFCLTTASVVGKCQGLKNWIKRYRGTIISGYLPDLRHLLKKTHMLQGQTSADKSYGKNSKATQVVTFFGEYKGNQLWEMWRAVCSQVHREGNGVPAWPSFGLCQLMHRRLLWAEQSVALQGPHAVYLWPAATIQTPLCPCSERWFGQ